MVVSHVPLLLQFAGLQGMLLTLHTWFVAPGTEIKGDTQTQSAVSKSHPPTLGLRVELHALTHFFVKEKAILRPVIFNRFGDSIKYTLTVQAPRTEDAHTVVPTGDWTVTEEPSGAVDKMVPSKLPNIILRRSPLLPEAQT